MRLALTGLLALSMLKGCDLGNPQSVQPRMEEAIRPYFPKVKAYALPDRNMLVGLSCLENVGDALIQQIGPVLANNPSMGDLRLLRKLPGSSYRYVGIGFEQGIAWYDLDTKSVGTQPTNPDYVVWYRKQCGLVTTGSVNARYGNNVWVGHFTATLQMPDGTKTIARTVDSLGVWGDDSFPAHRDQEIASRTELMRKNYWDTSGIMLLDITLDGVEKVPIPHN